MNPHGFGLDKIKKLEHFKRACCQKQIQCYLFSVLDRRWTSILKEQMRNQLRKIKRNAMIMISDLGDSLYVRKTWLSGGIILAI